MGLAVVGFSLLGVSGVLWLAGDSSILLGFSFGASSLALFAKAGGGIFTKTADVSADLTGKVELGIPEDDPRKSCGHCRQRGDNVGDVAGMGADLFDSNVAAMTSALVIAQTLGGQANTAMVFCYAALGLIASIVGIATRRHRQGGSPTRALNASTYVTTGLFIALTALATAVFDGFRWQVSGARLPLACWWASSSASPPTTSPTIPNPSCSGWPTPRAPLGLYGALGHLLRLYLGAAGDDRYRRVGPHGLPSLRPAGVATTPCSALRWPRWACSPSWA